MKDIKQTVLFEEEKKGDKEWGGMPEFSMKRIYPFKSITINFTCQDDVDKFEKLLGEKIKSYNTYWFPKQNIKTYSDKAYFDNDES